MVGFTGGIDPAPRYIEGPLIYADGTLRFTKNGIAELFSNNHGAVMGHIYTRVFKKNDRVCVQTQRSDERDFIQDLAAKLPRIDALDLPLVLKSAIDIVCRLRGYKVEEVAEERVLWAGSLPPAEGDEVAAVIATLDD